MTVDQRRIIHVHVYEIVRTLAVAIRRYGELLGPSAKHDALLGQLILKLQARPAPPGVPVPQSMVDCLLAVASRAAGRTADAPGLLRRSMVAGGEFEHPLTPIVLLELGHLALGAANFKEAGDFFEKATYAAAQYYDQGSPGWPGAPDAIEEAFRYGFIAHHLANHGKPFTLAGDAAVWARQKRLKFLQASLLLDQAESYAAERNTAAAYKTFDQAAKLVATRGGEMVATRIGARTNRLGALIRYQQGRSSDGDEVMAQAVSFQKAKSIWLFHISLADALYLNPPAGFSQRDAMALFETVLRNPSRFDWEVQPLEALSVMLGGALRGAALEHWFELTLQSDRAGGPKALEIADTIRQHRFHSSLMFGGRLLSLRWLMEAPEAELTAEDLRQRRDLLTKYRDYEKLAAAESQIRKDLSAIPLVTDPDEDRETAERQKKKLGELAAAAAAKEAILRQIAVDRVYAPLVFPPARKTKDVQAALPEGTALLVFLATTPSVKSPSRLYAFLVVKDDKKYPAWRVRDPATMVLASRKMLKAMGNFNERRAVTVDELTATEWRDQAKYVFQQLFTTSEGSSESLPGNMRELVVVPDAELWYLPFEALAVPTKEGGTVPLISKVTVRYAPTMSLAIPGSRGRATDGNTAVATGRLFPGRDQETHAQAALAKLRQSIPGAVGLPSVLPAPSAVYSTLFDRLVVLDDLTTGGAPYGWSPINVARGPGGSLDTWMPLPWGGPDQVILPGFHTAAENALDEKHGRGHEVFLSVCGMMACGTRTVLISRWRTGGKASFDLVREFTQELRHTSAAKAWQRSVLLCTESPLIPDLEPRIQPSAKGLPPTMQHPFFWSGYLLVDTGIGESG